MSPIPSSCNYSHIFSTLVVAGSSSQQFSSVGDDVATSVTNLETGICNINVSAVQDVVRNVDKQKYKCNCSRYEIEHFKARKAIASVISCVALNICSSVSCTLKDEIMQGTLDIKNLWLAIHLLKGCVVRSTAFSIINNCIQKIGKECVSEKDKENALAWIPDEIKSKCKIMKYFHGDQCVNIDKLTNGDLDVLLVSESLKILCLYVSRKYARNVLVKYKNKLPANVFGDLCLYLDQTCQNRTKSIWFAINYIQSFPGISPVVSTVDTQRHVAVRVSTKPVKRGFERPAVKSAIRIASRKEYLKKPITKSLNKIDTIKRQLLSGSLPLNEILLARLFLLKNMVPLNKVSRWFRLYRNMVCRSISISGEDKKKFLSYIEESKSYCRASVQHIQEPDKEIVELIEKIKSDDVILSDLKRIRMRLLEKVGSDRTSHLFVSLKNRLLKKNPEWAYEINEAFNASKQRSMHNLSADEARLIKSLNDGTVPLTDLKDSFCKLEKIRKHTSMKSIICSYVKKAIESGVHASQILPHVPESIRASGALIQSCDVGHYEVIKGLKYGSLPFERLEEAAYVAINYFTPYVLFGMLLRYAYAKSKLNLQEQSSFRSLLVALEEEGFISVRKKNDKSDNSQASDIPQAEQCLSSSVLEMFEQSKYVESEQEKAGSIVMSFEDKLSDMMVIYGVDMDLQQALQLDVYESVEEHDVGSLHCLDMDEKDLLMAFRD